MPTAPIRFRIIGELANWGIIHRFYDPLRTDLLPALISDRTKAHLAGGGRFCHAGVS